MRRHYRAVADAVDRRNPPVSGATWYFPLSAVPAADDDRPLVFAFSGAGESALAFGPLARCLGEYPRHRTAAARPGGAAESRLDGPGRPYLPLRAPHPGHLPAGPVPVRRTSLGGVIAIGWQAPVCTGPSSSTSSCLDTIFDGPLGA